jgi:mannose-6-phosphate isomerase-like protein (cupin superfamily)/low affinity Fe/Cu permease
MQHKHLQFGHGFRILLGDSSSQAAQMTLGPGETEGGPDNRHRGADQWLFVVNGDGVAIVEGESVELRAGSLVLIQRGDRHEIRNTGDTPLKTLNIYVPRATRTMARSCRRAGNSIMAVQPEEPKASPTAIEWAVHSLTRWLGSTSALIIVLVVIGLWYLARPYFETREDWHNALIIPLTVLTFLLIFLLQRTQNKALLAIQLKLNEIVASQHGASNRLIDVENMTEEEVLRLHRH